MIPVCVYLGAKNVQGFGQLIFDCFFGDGKDLTDLFIFKTIKAAHPENLPATERKPVDDLIKMLFQLIEIDELFGVGLIRYQIFKRVVHLFKIQLLFFQDGKACMLNRDIEIGAEIFFDRQLRSGFPKVYEDIGNHFFGFFAVLKIQVCKGTQLLVVGSEQRIEGQAVVLFYSGEEFNIVTRLFHFVRLMKVAIY